MQKDILASKLVESDPNLSETARLSSTLYNIVIAQEELGVTQKDLCNTVKCQLCHAARASKGPDALSPSEGLEGQWASSSRGQ